MNFRILLTIIHDLTMFGISFFFALWARLDFDAAFTLTSELWKYLVMFAIINISLLKYMGLYHGIWRYASTHEIKSIIKSVSVSTLILIGTFFLIFRLENIPRSFPILLFFISILGVTSPRFLYRIFKDNIKKRNNQKIPVLVVGDSASTENFIRFTKQSQNSPYHVTGLISLKEKSVGRRIHNIPFLCSINGINSLEEKLKKEKTFPQRIIVSDHNIKSDLIESLFVFSKQNGLALGMLPKISEVSDSKDINFSPNPIVIEDVLGRKQKVNDSKILKNIAGKTVLITGAGGSIGSELSKQVYRLKPKTLILLENNEYSLYKISSQFTKNIVPSLTDIRDTKKLESILQRFKPDYVFHTAALKHITFVEEDPMEALKTNFYATVNICKLCIKHCIPQMVFISTDKAVDPTNIMGASKRLCEKYIQILDESSPNTSFTILRFGNVLGSTGSVIPIFEKQINNGGPITITHPKVERFFMTIREAVELVLISSQLDIKGNGKIFILEMGESIFIKELAKKMVLLSGKNPSDIKIEYTGLRKGEKLNEKLFFEKEKILKTDVKGILFTNCKLFCNKKNDYQKLIRYIEENNKKKSMEYFKKFLPEYLNE